MRSWGYRAVASILGCDHKTVKRYVEQAGARGQLAPVRQRARITDEFADLIRERVEMTRGKVTSKSLHRTLRAAGYEGSARSLRRALAAERDAYRARMAAEGRVFRPWVSAPGEWLLCDWGSAGKVATAAGPRPLSFFCSVLGYSRQRQITFSACERFPALAIGLASNLEQIGGVPHKVLFDNPRTVCVGDVAGAHVLNPDLVRLAAHYRFSPRTTEYYDPESKGKVEATVRFAKTGAPVVRVDAWSALSEGSTCKRAGLGTGAGRRDLHRPVARRPRRCEAQARSSPGPPRQAPPRAEWAGRGSNLAIRSDFCGRLTRRPGRDGSAIRSRAEDRPARERSREGRTLPRERAETPKTDLIPAEGFGSLDEANEAGVECCRRVNSEVHSETKRSPAELAGREREVLRALPPERPPLACGEQRKVDKLATIRFASGRYSVPHRLVGRSVEALATDRELIVTFGGVPVAHHALLGPGEVSVCDEHYPAPPPSGMRSLRPRTATERAFLGLGAQAEGYLRAGAAAGAARLSQRIDDAPQIAAIHGDGRARGALWRATRFGRFGRGDLEAIADALGATPPERREDAAPLRLPGVPEIPTRPISVYAEGAGDGRAA
ncbi:MAG: IS21 family transposase [Solirubrobacteraceae bacterium]